MLAPKVLMIGVLFGCSCLGCKVRIRAGSYEDENRAAVAALETLHQRLNSGDFEAIFASTSDPLRSQPKEELIKAMQATRDRWGKLNSAEVKARSCFPNQVRFLVEAHFEKGEAGEMVVFHVADEKALLEHFQTFPGPLEVPPDASNECRSTR